MSENVTISYEKGSVTIAKYSRIKIYHQSRGSIRGFVIGEDRDKLFLLIPYYPNKFYEGIIEGKEESFNKRDLKGFAFYPEVTVLETKNSKSSEGGSENGDD